MNRLSFHSMQAIFSILALLCVTCVTESHAVEGSASGEVVVTLPALAGILKWIQPGLPVRCMLPRGARPHHYHPGARQLEHAMRSSLLLRSSADDAAWVDLGRVGDGRMLDVWPVSAKGGNHAWLDPDAVQAVLPRLAQRLQTMGWLGDVDWHRRRPSLQREMKEVRMAWHALAPRLRAHGVIMQHPSWRAWFEKLGVPVYAVLERGGDGHHHGFRARTLERALRALQAHPRALLIADPRHDDQGLLWLKHRQSQAVLVYLDAMGACDEVWPVFMRRSLARLREAVAGVSSP